jgi:hypothetical protein
MPTGNLLRKGLARRVETELIFVGSQQLGRTFEQESALEYQRNQVTILFAPSATIAT